MRSCSRLLHMKSNHYSNWQKESPVWIANHPKCCQNLTTDYDYLTASQVPVVRGSVGSYALGRPLIRDVLFSFWSYVCQSGCTVAAVSAQRQMEHVKNITNEGMPQSVLTEYTWTCTCIFVGWRQMHYLIQIIKFSDFSLFLGNFTGWENFSVAEEMTFPTPIVMNLWS